MAMNKITLSTAANATEGGNNGSYLISLSKPAPANGLKINFNMAGNAKFNVDYTLSANTNITAVTNHSFTIAAGATSATLDVVAFTDNAKDINETATLNLKIGKGYSFVFDSNSFANTVDIATSSQPVAMCTGDFNGDGQLDFVVANYYSATVSVLLRNAANTGFETKIDYQTDYLPKSISAGDFNNDGKLDLAVAHDSSNSVSVLLRNTANTGFKSKIDIATNIGSKSLSTGDVNNDGQADLIVVNSSNNTVSVLLRNAANTGFEPKIDYATGTNPITVSTADFNNDGKLDLAVTNFKSNTVSVLLRNSDNTNFEPKIDYATGRNPVSVSTADFNNDGKLDLVVSNASRNSVSVLLRNGDNTGFEAKKDYPTSSYPIAVTTGDFNHDGKVDLVVANYYSNTLSVLLRNAFNTGFEKAFNYQTDSNPSAVSVGDFNHDGKLDLVTSNANSNSVSVLTNTSGATNLIIHNANALPTGAITITGVVAQKQVLTIANSLVDTDGLGAINYQWRANGISITHADKGIYKLTQNEVGKTITVIASYTDKHGNAETVSSVATTKVANINDLPTGTVTINDNTPEAGQRLTVSNTLADIDGLGAIKYTWLVDNQVVAINNKYIVTPNDSNKVITVVADYIDKFGTHEAVSSAKTYKVDATLRLNGSAANDTLNGSIGKDSINGYAADDVLNGNRGNDLLNGGSGNDVLDGNSGNDVLNGDSGNDKLYGHSSNDVLNGGSGHDKLYGGLASDTLDGGQGTDRLDGGNGSDTFALNNPAQGVDKIIDFSVIEDSIQLNHLSFTPLLIGVLKADNLIIGVAALDTNDYIIYNKTTGALFYDTDANGVTAAIEIATLGINLPLTNADFNVI